MNVIILAGGYAQRLWPLTQNYPKTLLGVAGSPVLLHVLHAVAPLAYKDSITIAIDKEKQDAFVEQLNGVEISPQPALSLHASSNGVPVGPLAKIREILREDQKRGLSQGECVLIGGDNVFGFNINRFREAQHASGQICVATQRVPQSTDSSHVGVPSLDSEGRFVGFAEKPSGVNFDLISTACYIFPRADLLRVDEYLRSGGEDSLGHFIEWCIEHTSGVRAFIFHEDWYDTGTRQGLLAANAYLLKATLSQPAFSVGGLVKVKQPVYVGDRTRITNSVIGPNVTLASKVQIIDSVVENSIVYEGSRITNSKIINSIIGPDSRVEGELNGGLLGPSTALFVG